MGRVRFLFTTTGFWLRRMALALRMAACVGGQDTGLSCKIAHHQHPPRAMFLGQGSEEGFLSFPSPGPPTKLNPPTVLAKSPPHYPLRRPTCVTHHSQVWTILVLADHVPDTAERGPSILVDGGPHIGGGWLSLA